MTSDIMIPDASALTVDTSCIDVSEVENQEDKKYLMDKGENILKIVAKAGLEIGQHLVEIQERFKSSDGRGKGLKLYYQSLGIHPERAVQWANKYRAFFAYTELFGPDTAAEKFDSMSDQASSLIWRLPPDYREAFLADIALGETPTEAQVTEVSQRPEVKLSKAEELLAAAKIRKNRADVNWEMVKGDPEIQPRSKEYNQASDYRAKANNSVTNFEQQIVELQAQIEEEKLRTAEETEEKARVEKELQKLKFDDASARAERVKRVSSTLTLSIPQTLADVQKFFAEANEYPDEVRKHIVEQSTLLANYIGDHI